MKKAEKLRPCPFCGGEAELVDCGFQPRWFVRCKHYDCIEQRTEWKTINEAVKWWNRRVKEEDALK